MPSLPLPDPAPGPPPGPPADLPARGLVSVVLAAGTPLFRIHPTRLDPCYYGPRADPALRGRWDAPDGSFGVCYFAETPHLAFAETLLRDLDLEEVGSTTLGARSLARVEATRDLVLVRMHGSGLRQMKATGAVVQGPYEVTWAWSGALYGHPSAVDGIRYRGRHDDDALAVALFQRAAPAIRVVSSVRLLDPSLAAELGTWLDRYEIGLGP